MPAVEQAARRWWFLRVSQSILMKASYLGCLIADLKHYCIHPGNNRWNGSLLSQQEENRWNGGFLSAGG
ncbi:hypothetical protein HanXRQr2_Chr08g0317751 [Helianthus annuus]|uniref:Uncharacterized protein n=1 Tax=Helianthus annuus TaxID=4232 RepID=A0A9K3EBX4_HELAN|nr:hypothetical protein HanXRQr2_Chr14g0662431 [Helianthus annuus]KAF5793558.1 hypothetical protein HanXRQr2_Chr08g0317751 [Helianthus annuus]